MLLTVFRSSSLYSFWKQQQQQKRLFQTLMGLVVLITEYPDGWSWKGPLKVTCSNPCSSRDAQSWLSQATSRWLLKVSKGKTPQPLWATCASARSLAQHRRASKCLAGISCAPVRDHCLLSWHWAPPKRTIQTNIPSKQDKIFTFIGKKHGNTQAEEMIWHFPAPWSLKILMLRLSPDFLRKRMLISHPILTVFWTCQPNLEPGSSVQR